MQHIISRVHASRRPINTHAQAGKLVCTELLEYTIDEEKCIGCMACVKKCPADAIKGAKRSPHYIIQDKCIRCGACVATCKFDAVNAS